MWYTDVSWTLAQRCNPLLSLKKNLLATKSTRSINVVFASVQRYERLHNVSHASRIFFNEISFGDKVSYRQLISNTVLNVFSTFTKRY